MLHRREKQSVRHPGAGRFLIVTALLLAACSHHEAPVTLTGLAQGTFYSIKYYDSQHRNLQPQIDSLLAAFDLSASLWVDSSLLRRVNANLTDSLDQTLTDLLSYSVYINNYTEGAFDCRVGRIVQAWGFSFRERSEPDSATLSSLLTAAHAPVTIRCNRIVKDNPSTELDFNAIAQGYSADLVGKWLASQGVNDFIVNIGGEVVARGTKQGGQPWCAGIERPSADSIAKQEVMTSIVLRDASVVTSGNYRKYYERDGVRYSHTIDPATGRPVQHSLLSVSVVEEESWLADAMATAYMVMGLDRALAFIDAHPDGPGTKAVMFIYDDGGTMKTYETPEFKKLIK